MHSDAIGTTQTYRNVCYCRLSAAARAGCFRDKPDSHLRSRAFCTIVGEISFGNDATRYFGVLAVTSTSMSIPGHASAVTTRNVPAGWVAPAYASFWSSLQIGRGNFPVPKKFPDTLEFPCSVA